MAFSLSAILTDVQKGLAALPAIVQTAQAIKATGMSQESTLAKVSTIVGLSLAAAAQAGEEVPNPTVQAISTLVGTIVEETFAAASGAAAPTVSSPSTP